MCTAKASGQWWGKSIERSGVTVRERTETLNMVVSQTQGQSCNRSLNSSCLVILRNPADLEEANRSAESLFSIYTMLKVTFKLVQVNKPWTNHHPFTACTIQNLFLSVILHWTSSGLMAFLNRFVCIVLYISAEVPTTENLALPFSTQIQSIVE